ncbi:MAG: WD40 repeat domain-containing protein [Nostoc sp. DedQUE08]|uniref:WD40 repeat domain-containing protein n=1 Tax=unclassified Nostoc TaxID=2593658 RepID=UPI002AD570C5|nr:MULTISPECIES: WD40 repeat domain-containing protein [unclassified Nostoc]MDZ8067685.1 WD40 repeat domain-containing protein [Nostoc sp. DedQUE08]MDZ8092071.1 WD40 repeat domain-containing protein [Nostoc sp. DedQUE05]
MGEFADKLAAQSPAFQRAYLGSLAPNLVKSGKLEKYYQTLTNFDFMVAKINHPEFGVQPLIEDYDLIKDSEVLKNPEYNQNKIHVLKLIEGTLRLSAHILNKNQIELLPQLWGRLLSFELPEIKAFLMMVKQSQSQPQPWFRPLIPSLDPPGRTLLRTLTGHSSSVDAITVTSNGKYIISGSNDKTLKVWDLEIGKEISSFTGHTDKINTIVVTPDDKLLISGSNDKTIKIWDLETGTELYTLIGHTDSVQAVALTPNGKQVISSSIDNTLKVWNLKTGQEIFSITGNGNQVNTVTVTPDSKHLIYHISYDNSIQVLDLESQNVIASFTGESALTCCAVASDGMTIVAGEASGRVHFLRLETR